MPPLAGFGPIEEQELDDNFIQLTIESASENFVGEFFEAAWFVEQEKDELKGYLLDDVCIMFRE